MPALPNYVYLVAAYFVVANGMPRNMHRNTMSQMTSENGGIFNTVAHSQFTTYSSYGSFGNFDFSDYQDRLTLTLFNMLKYLKSNLPEIFINPRNVFGLYSPPDLVDKCNPNDERTPKYFPTTRRNFRPIPSFPTTPSYRPAMRPIPSSKTTPAVLTTRRTVMTTTKPTPEPTTVIIDTEEDYNDNIRPIVLKDLNTLKNEVPDPTSRPVPDVEHGSSQAGSQISR